MSMGVVLLAVLLSFVPAMGYVALLYILDRFEKEPVRVLLGAFAWGAVVATIGAIIGTMVLQWGLVAFSGDEDMAAVTGTVLFAPVVEELTKGAAVLLVLLVFRAEFDSVVDGMVYAGVAALGFAATENVIYLLCKGYQVNGLSGMLGLFVLRVVLGGWLHPAFTAWFGAGLAMARLTRRWPAKVAWAAAGLLVAIGMHALHNAMATFVAEGNPGGLLATLVMDWLGWVVIFGIFTLGLLQERGWIRRYLVEEVTLGVLSEGEYRVAGSLRGQMKARLRLGGAARFYQACAELAFTKHQVAALGEAAGAAGRIGGLRAEVERRRGGPPRASGQA